MYVLRKYDTVCIYVCMYVKLVTIPEISKNFMYLSAAVVASCLPSADIAREYMQPGGDVGGWSINV